MKKVWMILAILLLPISIWAMTPINDSDLSHVTGQAGVNINADLTMNISIGTMAWGDSDGIHNDNVLWDANASAGNFPWADVPTGGYIGMTGFNITNLKIRARTDSTDSYNSYSTLLLKPITIDVATDSTTGHGVSGTTFVRFGLGALQINMDALSFEVALGSHLATNYIGVTPTLNQDLGTVSLGGMGIYINPWSYVDIYNGRGAGTSGVTFAFNVIIDRFTMDYMSWGDKDGLPGGNGSTNNAPAGFLWTSTTTAGYVGLNNFRLGNATSPAVTVTGQVSIDVLTDNSSRSAYSCLQGFMSTFRAAMLADGYDPLVESEYRRYMTDNGITEGTPLWQLMGDFGFPQSSVSVVHISFPTDMNVVVNSMWADVQVASSANLGGVVAGGGSATGGELGDIYIQGLNFTMKAGSWVDIWAH